MQMINDEIIHIFERIKSDPLTQEFRDNLSTLGRSMVMNPQGEPDLFVLQQSLDEIKNLLIVMFKRALTDISFEKIQIRNAKYDITLKEIKLRGHEFAPKRIRVGVSTDSIINFHRASKSSSKYTLKLSVDNLRPELKDFKFDFKKKKFPAVRDHGTADVLFTGSGVGASAIITLSAESGKAFHSSLTETTVTVDPIKIHVEDAKHGMLDSILAPIFARALQGRLQLAIKTFLEQRLRDVIHQLNEFIASKPIHRLAERGNTRTREMYTSRTEKSKSTEGEKHGKMHQKLGKPKRKQSAGERLNKKPVGTVPAHPAGSVAPKHAEGAGHTTGTEHPKVTDKSVKTKTVETTVHPSKHGEPIVEPKREALA